MMFGNLCPVCGQEVSSERLLGGSMVCSCGYTDDRARVLAERMAENRSIIGFMVVCASLVVLFAHAVNWGGHMWSIPVLKIQQMTGTVSASGLEGIIQACFDQSKWDCVQDTHAELYKKTRNPAVLARLADFRLRLNRADDALLTYDWYVRAGGRESEALYRYADLLEKAGKKTQALDFYAKSVANSGQRLPVRAMSGLLRLFMQEGRYQEAGDHLKAFHGSAGNAKDYFATEAEVIKENLKKGKRLARR